MWNHVLYVRDVVKGLSYRARLVLYALASRADRNGICRPSTETIVSDTGLSRRGVQRAIEEIDASEVVLLFGGKYLGRTNRYKFPSRMDQQVVNSSDGKTEEVCQPDAPPPEKNDGGVRQVGVGGAPSWRTK